MKDSFPSFTETVKPTTRFTAAQLYGPNRDLDHFALRPQKRGGLLGTGTGGGKGTKERRLDLGYRPKETGETVDRRQNNGSVKEVSLRHCTAQLLFQLPCWAESQGRCPLHFC